MESLRGQLLIASPSLVDPNFHRSVVLITHHDEDGAMGLVLNHPSSTAVADAVPELEDLVELDDWVYVGGPVEPGAALLLAELENPAEATAVVFADIGFPPEDPTPGSTRRLRVFAGYAGWGAGQLEAELEEAAWIVTPADREDVFVEDADELWSAVLRRKGGRFAILATMPPDPSLN
jgi:putative transcriptional regulator